MANLLRRFGLSLAPDPGSGPDAACARIPEAQIAEVHSSVSNNRAGYVPALLSAATQSRRHLGAKFVRSAEPQAAAPRPQIPAFALVRARRAAGSPQLALAIPRF